MTGELSHPRSRVLLDSREFEHLCYSRPADAHLRPRRRRRRPREPARRAVARPGRRPPRGDPGRGRPSTATFPDWLDARIVAGLADARHRAAVSPPGRGDRGGPRRRGRRRRHADRVGQDAVLHAADPPGHRRRPGVAGALPVPDQGARPGPGGRVRRAVGGGRHVDPRVDLRRRHAGADPLGRPGRRPGRRDEPGHAPLGDPAPPHEVVPAVRAAPDHRHRRAAHVPRRVRQPRRQRPAPAAPDLRPLRQPPGHRLLLGDDREPGRARGDAHRTAGPARRPQRRPGRRAARRPRRPAGPRTRERRPGVGGHPRPALGAAVPAGRSPDDRLRTVAGRGRAAAHRAARVAARELRTAQPGPRLPRRLPADGTPVHRARPARRRGPRRRRDERARARRGHRPARRRDPRRLPGLGRRHLAAVRAGRATARDERRGPRGIGRAGRPVRHPPPGVPARQTRPRRPASTRTTCTSCSPTCGPRPSSCRSSRASGSDRARPTTCSRSSPRSATSARRTTVAGTGRARTSRRRRSRCARPRRRTSSSSTRRPTGRASSARSTCSAPRSSSTSGRSTSTSRSSTTSTGSSGASARRTSTASTSTTTRTPTGR